MIALLHVVFRENCRLLEQFSLGARTLWEGPSAPAARAPRAATGIGQSRSSRLFPGLQLQHWDIANDDNDLQIMELNVNGGLAVRQLAEGRGILDGCFAEVG